MPEPTDLAVFVSHSSADSVLARTCVELLEKALKLRASQIRCTSVTGYGLAAGADTNEQLRQEIFGASAFIALITPTSAKSAFVLFELGARWGAKLHLAPVLASGADPAFLGGPLAGINALSLNEKGQVLQLVEDIARHLALPLEPMASFQRAVAATVAAASVATVGGELPTTEHEVSEPEIAVLQYLASIPEDETAEQVGRHLSITEQKAKYWLMKLDSKGMVFVSPIVYNVTTYAITQAGREVLVRLNLL